MTSSAPVMLPEIEISLEESVTFCATTLAAKDVLSVLCTTNAELERLPESETTLPEIATDSATNDVAEPKARFPELCITTTVLVMLPKSEIELATITVCCPSSNAVEVD